MTVIVAFLAALISRVVNFSVEIAVMVLTITADKDSPEAFSHVAILAMVSQTTVIAERPARQQDGSCVLGHHDHGRLNQAASVCSSSKQTLLKPSIVESGRMSSVIRINALYEFGTSIGRPKEPASQKDSHGKLHLLLLTLGHYSYDSYAVRAQVPTCYRYRARQRLTI